MEEERHSLETKHRQSRQVCSSHLLHQCQLLKAVFVCAHRKITGRFMTCVCGFFILIVLKCDADACEMILLTGLKRRWSRSLWWMETYRLRLL